MKTRAPKPTADLTALILCYIEPSKTKNLSYTLKPIYLVRRSSGLVLRQYMVAKTS